MNIEDKQAETEIASRIDCAESAASSQVSLENVHGSVEVPQPQASFWKKWRAFVGPAILVSVGYMDPGNWGTDLQGGAQFKYGLLWVVGLASLMAIFMQVISARLGVVICSPSVKWCWRCSCPSPCFHSCNSQVPADEWGDGRTVGSY